MKLMKDDGSLGHVTAEATSSGNSRDLKAPLCMTGRVTIADASLWIQYHELKGQSNEYGALRKLLQ